MQLPLPATIAIETAFNTLLKLDESALARLPSMQGKIIALHLRGLEMHVYFLVHADKVEVMRFFDGDVDATISGAPFSMMSLAASNRALFSGEVAIDGDVETGKRFNRLLESLEIDWEEQLSRVTGDIVAHQVGNVIRDVHRWLDRSAHSFSADLSDYLREEALLTPTQNECEHFYSDVDTLRADVDRLEARLQKFENNTDQQNAS